MDLAAIIRSQYLAALDILEQTLRLCPEPIWNSPDDKTKFWHIAYHALFYTHLYLQDTEKTSRPGPATGRSTSPSAGSPGRLTPRRASGSPTTKTACWTTWPSAGSRSPTGCRA